MKDQNNQPLMLDLCKEKLGIFAQTLHRSIIDWERDQRELRNDRYFNGYEEIAFRLNIHPSTIYKMTNRMQPQIPNLITLVQICLVTDDDGPLDCAYEICKNITKGKKISWTE